MRPLLLGPSARQTSHTPSAVTRGAMVNSDTGIGFGVLAMGCAPKCAKPKTLSHHKSDCDGNSARERYSTPKDVGLLIAVEPAGSNRGANRASYAGGRRAESHRRHRLRSCRAQVSMPSGTAIRAA